MNTLIATSPMSTNTQIATNPIPINTRIAPSPTGLFHLGTGRTAYHCWLAARSSGGSFMLRIDDTDAERNKEEYVDVIFQGMTWLGLDWDRLERQSKRFDRYLNVASELIKCGFARRCDDQTVRLTPDFIPPEWKDEVGGSIKVSKNDQEIIENLVLVRSNGAPTYHFASIVDDIDFDIDLIIRGTDHISNTPKQITIANCVCKVLNKVNKLRFAHVGLIHKDGKKMSKRDGACNILDYKINGIRSDATLNFLLKLGWNLPDPNIDKVMPLIPKEKAIEVFPKGKLKSSSSQFDHSKLEWFNRKYQECV